MLRKGDVLVIDRLGDHKHACIGGGVMCAIKASGCSGVIVDGTITDINELLEYDIPIWSRGLSPITTRLYNIGGALNTPVSIGGAAVLPGYCVIADDSGVLFLPPDECLPIVNDLCGLPFHKFFLSTKTVPLVDFVYDLKIFNAIKLNPSS